MFALPIYVWNPRLHSERVFAGVAGADAYGLVKVVDENLAVADLAGMSRLADRIDRGIELVVGHRDFDLHFRQEIDHVLGPASSEEHTSELQSPMRNPYAVSCLNEKTTVSLHTLERVKQ